MRSPAALFLDRLYLDERRDPADMARRLELAANAIASEILVANHDKSPLAMIAALESAVILATADASSPSFLFGGNSLMTTISNPPGTPTGPGILLAALTRAVDAPVHAIASNTAQPSPQTHGEWTTTTAAAPITVAQSLLQHLLAQALAMVEEAVDAVTLIAVLVRAQSLLPLGLLIPRQQQQPPPPVRDDDLESTAPKHDPQATRIHAVHTAVTRAAQWLHTAVVKYARLAEGGGVSSAVRSAPCNREIQVAYARMLRLARLAAFKHAAHSVAATASAMGAMITTNMDSKICHLLSPPATPPVEEEDPMSQKISRRPPGR
ncbi:hypothetical protein BC828DRAFT_403239 [Blastocladiella britannica]|nr:hypothetical protein BC828DRAFT_403239 [Blastocladiella britannica]